MVRSDRGDLAWSGSATWPTRWTATSGSPPWSTGWLPPDRPPVRPRRLRDHLSSAPCRPRTTSSTCAARTGRADCCCPGCPRSSLRDDLDAPGRHVLLNRRSDSGRWSLPSGIVEPDEQPAAALAREVAEETCVEVDVERLALLVTEPEMTFGNGDRCQFVSMTFRCRYRSGRPRSATTSPRRSAGSPSTGLPADLRERDRRRIAVALSDQDACVFEV